MYLALYSFRLLEITLSKSERYLDESVPSDSESYSKSEVLFFCQCSAWMVLNYIAIFLVQLLMERSEKKYSRASAKGGLMC